MQRLKLQAPLSHDQSGSRRRCAKQAQPGIRAGPVVIVPLRPCAAAPLPLKPLPRLTVTDFFLHFFSTAPPGRGSFRCKAAAMQYCAPLPWYLQSSQSESAQWRGDDASNLRHPFRSLFGLKKNRLDFRSTGTHRRGDPSDVRSSGFSTDHSHSSVV